ncbi:MAG: HPr family phosphocarrier protein [Actinomycetes bacterium]
MFASSDTAHQTSVVLVADLHARPAGRVTQVAAGFKATVWLAVDDRPRVDARSVLAVMGLGAVAGQTVTVTGEGVQAREGVAAVADVLSVAATDD